MKGLRFERIGKNRYYNVVFHMGSAYVPVSDETVEELKAQSLLPVEQIGRASCRERVYSSV